MSTKRVAIGFLGTTLDAGRSRDRHERWRPTVSLAHHAELRLDRLELLVAGDAREAEVTDPRALVSTVVADLHALAPTLEVRVHALGLRDPWDFEEVYGKLFDFARSYPFDVDRAEYLLHIATGTHVAQICCFLLAESRHIPARLLQTSPGRGTERARGEVSIIDLDLARYDAIASRFRVDRDRGQDLLKGGIATRNAVFNAMIAELEHVAVASSAPILLHGPTGSGKSQLAKRIFALKKARRAIKGELVELNCATLRGDLARSTLFGHVRGAFTGASADRTGLLKKADGGVLFLDEIGELGLDEQAMLLIALEEKRFTAVGSDREVRSDFVLLAGTHRDLDQAVRDGRFREDLLARIDLWAFRLPALRERLEDLEPNLAFELERASSAVGAHVTISREARTRFLAFAERYPWPGNFRDFAGSITRMATLATGGRITVADVDREIARREARGTTSAASSSMLTALLGAERAASLDRFDRVQLEDVVAVCLRASSLSDAGRILFAESRKTKSSSNDADRLRKYLARFELTFPDVREALARGQKP